jgi:hypothetical protein
MERHPSELDPRLRRENRQRILEILVRRMEAGEVRSSRHRLEPGLSDEEKLDVALLSRAACDSSTIWGRT